MSERELCAQVLAKTAGKIPRGPAMVAVAFVIAGVVGFILGATGPESTRAWQIFLVNMLFWSGIAQAGIVFSAVMHLANGRWGVPMKRVAEGLSTFLPISFLLFFLIIVGRRHIFPWLTEPPEVEIAWLKFPFLFTRDLIGLMALGGLGMAYLYYSIRPDAGLVMEMGQGGGGIVRKMLTKGWMGLEEEQRRSREALSTLSVVFIVVYAFVFSLLAVDLIMSLDTKWYSSLFGGYFFIGNIYLGLAFLALVSIGLRKYYGLEEFITIGHLHDLGKFMFAFCMLTGDFLWSQYLVIWYGNLAHESSFIITRVYTQPWRNLFIFVMVVGIFVPFMLLIPKRIKRHPYRLFSVALLIVVSMWFERFLMIVPSIWKEGTFPLGWIEALTTLGFFGAVMLTLFTFLQHFPVLPISEPRLQKGYNIRTY